LQEALVGVQPTDTEIQEVIRWLEAQPADWLARMVALLEYVRQAGYTDGRHDCRDRDAPAARAGQGAS
jgi:hypothetical protein